MSDARSVKPPLWLRNNVVFIIRTFASGQSSCRQSESHRT